MVLQNINLSVYIYINFFGGFNMMKKRSIFIALILLLMLTVSVPVCADSQVFAETVQLNGQLSPNYTYLSAVGSTLSIENGYATCSGFMNLFRDYNSTITITLQSSANGSSWSNVTSWSQSFSGTGLLSIEKGYYVSSGYTYRVLNTAQVKNGTSILETATCYSPEEQY
jgi:hypothetical protein